MRIGLLSFNQKAPPFSNVGVGLPPQNMAAPCGGCGIPVMLVPTNDGLRPMTSKYWRQDYRNGKPDGITVFCGPQCSLDVYEVERLKDEPSSDES